MRKNDDITIKTESLNSDGAAVGRYENEVVFIPYAIPGETVEAHIIKTAKTYAVGKLTKVITPSASRKTPECPHFYRCGGCDLQHIEYSEQLRLKCESTLKNINKLAGTVLSVKEIIGAEKCFGYRTKAQFPTGKNANGEFVLGFFSPRSHNVVATDECLLQDERCNAVIPAVKKAFAASDMTVYDELSHSGVLRHVIVRAAKNGLMVIIVTNSRKELSQSFVQTLKNGLPQMTSLVQNINTQKGNVILGNECRVIYGDGFVSDELCGIKFNLRPLAFLQVNPYQAEKLYNTVAELAGDDNGLIFDAYCGIGVMSLMLAKKAKKLVGVEIIPEAIESAKESARINGITNAEFLTGACEDILPRLLASDRKPDLLVVDPPRAGCDEALLSAVANADIERMIYVSCNPSTLARDIKILSALGYTPSDLIFVDMFCQTKHVETVCELKKTTDGR